MDKIPMEYYFGLWDALLYMQADRDTEENKNQRPTITVRLPTAYGPCYDNDLRFDMADFEKALQIIDEEAGIVGYNIVKVSDEEVYIEVASTEGYQGMPEDWPEEEDHGTGGSDASNPAGQE